MKIPPLFVYGTLMNPSTRVDVLGRECALLPATLEGYRVQVGKWPYLVRSIDETVSGLLLLNLDVPDYKKLDDYEDVANGFYLRQSVEAFDENGNIIACYVYLPVLDRWPKEWLAA